MNPAADPEWLAHRFDWEQDRIRFLQVPRGKHAGVPFLTDEYLQGAAIAVPRRQALAAAAAPGPVHFIFHSAFCCSTLLVRAFDVEGVAMGLSEPVILNDLIGWRHRGRPAGPQVAEALDQALRLLARPFGPGESIVLKPSNLVNPLIRGMMELRPEARALFLHAPLEDYLGSVARKQMWGRLWVRDLLAKLLREGMVELGLAGDDYLRLTDLQAAAIGWLAQQAQFAALAARYGPARVRTLDSETLMRAPAAALGALGDHFGLALDAEEVAAGPAFRRNSKTGGSFSAAERAAERARGLALHAEELTMVKRWAGEVAGRFGVPMALPGGLLAAGG